LGGAADAWNMLYGSAKEGWGSECQITELHNAATEAKRNYESLAKVCLPLMIGGWLPIISF